jgi:hypothetical protein
MMLFRAVFFVFCLTAACLAQRKPDVAEPVTLDRVEGERLGREIVRDLLSRRPDHGFTNQGTLTIRHKGTEKHLAIESAVFREHDAWVTLYRARGPEGKTETLSVVRSEKGPAQYAFDGGGDSAARPKPLDQGQTMRPFAGSDFWIADLGLQFFEWSGQRVLRKQMKRGQSCDVLESTGGPTQPGGYARVVSWLDADTDAIIYAEAFDSSNRKLKEFAPKKIEKVKGAWELRSMEMSSPLTGSRSTIEFDLDR